MTLSPRTTPGADTVTVAALAPAAMLLVPRVAVPLGEPQFNNIDLYTRGRNGLRATVPGASFPRSLLEFLKSTSANLIISSLAYTRVGDSLLFDTKNFHQQRGLFV
jgi:hypothetical protein